LVVFAFVVVGIVTVVGVGRPKHLDGGDDGDALGKADGASVGSDDGISLGTLLGF